MTKKAIHAFVSKYLDDDGKPYEVLTEYRHYNQDLINQDRDIIIDFFSNIYKLSSQMSFKDLQISKDGEKLYELRYLYELDEFEDLIGLLFASGILIDSLITRVEIMAELDDQTRYLIRDLNNGDNYPEEDYVAYIDKYILPIHIFEVNKNVIKRQKKGSKQKKIIIKEHDFENYTKEELKDILTYWFLKDPTAKVLINLFEYMLNTRIYTILNYAAIMEMSGPNAQSILIINMILHTHLNLLDEIEARYSKLSPEAREELNQYKDEFVARLSKEMKEKNRHL